ncbi:hypothetical protein EO98_15515 [Methanosarcina sp. 2.H.T.1A.6]|uniref:hypothetical protein n=1 Tax=unclassified Methanosarcina TaxID=2644672 RepID=UPI0006225B13|nr:MULTISPECIES: hypothetical protein [unclassified Methanosarcina]KKG15222.1 hypothetical protein EO94_06870 [Methanosarcina sp. 2.H.T.1A.3]KKG22907.1 hypothetical protein EO98_15515 [Methanosarcina sp. 2.H.T.1A.6]KKG24362.1 hypothetical protein EO96_14345 [Methanosarcina sp. 2.H.T.1A.8]KKG29151.1 hypothetical protein EO97_15650 [Methanosarcina sp. 2.H.T.1A.15]
MGCNPVTFHNVTPNVFNCMKQKLESAGLHVPSGNSGEISGSGVVADFNWDGTANLTITVKSKPFIVSCDTVTGKIQDFVHQCGA